MAKEAPRWERAAGELMLRAQRSVQVIGRATPVNLGAELEALAVDFKIGRERAPRFRYDPAAPSDLEGELARLGDELDREADPLAPIYAARARELCIELAICVAAGRDSLWQLARQRYCLRDEHALNADALAREWLEPPGSDSSADEQPEGDTVQSDDAHDPRSLVSRMRQELGVRRLPVRVVLTEHLAALAATGHGVIFVASARKLQTSDVERTVLHEIEGHALPRQRAEQLALAIFRTGTAFGSDDQEGRALAIEQAGGWLRRDRQQELARRHLACRSVEARSSFVDTVRLLLELGAPLRDALRIAARAHRGGGLGRESVYLPGYLRVTAALRAEPALDSALSAGRIAVDTARALGSWL